MRLIDAKAFDFRVSEKLMSEVFPNWVELPKEVQDAVCKHGQYLHMMLETQPTVDAVELPCKIGDKVYRIDKGNYHSNWKPFVEELTVTEISWKKEKYGDKDLGFAIIANGIRYKFTSIGKSVFLTRKEAEAKMDGDGNG